MWDMYKKAIASFWTAEEIDLQGDKHWDMNICLVQFMDCYGKVNLPLMFMGRLCR